VCLLRVCGTDWVFICFVRIWEQTAIISLYSINWLVFITETECVYCAVRTGSLYVLCGSGNRQRLFPYTALTECCYNRGGNCLLRGTGWIFKCINLWLRIGHAMFMQVITACRLRRTRFHPRSVRVRFAVHKGTPGQVFHEYFILPKLLSFHYCSILALIQ
jgi:hypothetical protein